MMRGTRGIDCAGRLRRTQETGPHQTPERASGRRAAPTRPSAPTRPTERVAAGRGVRHAPSATTSRWSPTIGRAGSSGGATRRPPTAPSPSSIPATGTPRHAGAHPRSCWRTLAARSERAPAGHRLRRLSCASTRAVGLRDAHDASASPSPRLSFAGPMLSSTHSAFEPAGGFARGVPSHRRALGIPDPATARRRLGGGRGFRS